LCEVTSKPDWPSVRMEVNFAEVGKFTRRSHTCGEGASSKQRDGTWKQTWMNNGNPGEAAGKVCWSEGRSVVEKWFGRPQGFG
ncbi:hypothetical protein NPIL_38141, partial [Nephila pilipes]